jgi:hypothetical protein
VAELWPHGPLTLPHEIRIDGHSVLIPEVPTATLLGIIARGCWWEFFPVFADPATMEPVLWRFYDDDDPFEFEHLWTIATILLGRLSGMATIDGSTDGWWPARRMAATALGDWASYAAWCATHGCDPLDGPLYRVVGAIYGWLIDRAGYEGRSKLDQQIFGPPPHVPINQAAVPRHLRDAEAAMALAALREAGAGDMVAEWTPPPTG